MLKQIKIKNISSADYAKVAAITSFFLGILVGILYIGLGILMLVIPSAKLSSTSSTLGSTMGFIYVGCGFLYPFFLALITLITTYIGTSIINWVLRKTGGVRVDYEEVGQFVQA